jgi:hypothetical protein
MVVVALVAQVLTPVVDFYTRPLFKCAFLAVFGCAAALAQRRKALAEDADLAVQRRGELDDVLACFPAPTVAEANAYDLGTVPFRAQRGEASPPPYVDRDDDVALRRALRASRLVIVIGDAGVGKSRSCFEGLVAARPLARLLVPEGGDALGRLLVHDISELVGPEGGVLWLDELERYLAGLRVDAIDVLCNAGIQVVATVRSQTLHGLLGSSSEEGRAARRLLARATVVEVQPQLSPGEQTLAGHHYPAREFGQGLSGAFGVWPCTDSAAFEPPRRPEAAGPNRLRNDWVGQLFMGLLASSVGWCGYLLKANQVRAPDSIADQVAAARDDARPCAPTELFPPKASDAKTYVLVVHASRGCNSSDELQVLQVHGDDLRRDYHFKPENPQKGGFFQLVCRGGDAAMPCSVPGAGSAPAIVAGWLDTAAEIILPFVVRKTKDGYTAVGIDSHRVVDPGHGPAHAPRARYRKPVTVQDGERRIRGFPVEDFAIVSAGATSQLVRGYTWRGLFNDPQVLESYSAALNAAGGPPDTCTYDNGSKRAFVKVPTPSPGVSTLLRRDWRGAVRKGRASCD